MRAKITIVGAGNVGATLAQRLAERDDADIVLIDVVDGLPQGKALDMMQAGPVVGYDTLITGTSTYVGTEGSAVVVVTGGIARKPGMSRDDLVMTNARIIASVARQVAARAPGAVLVMVSNPLDVMAQVARAVTGFPRERVIGMAGILDTARFRTFLAQEVHASVRDVHAYVLGGHGDSMVPLTRMSTVAGVPVTELIASDRLDAIVERTRKGGGEIVELLKSGSAYYAPSAAVAQMVHAILHDTREILPCAAYLQGEYGVHNLYTGVPCRLGAGGLLEVVALQLTEGERAALQASARAVQEVVEFIDRRRVEIDPEMPHVAEGARVGD